MNRKEFLKKTLLTTGSICTLGLGTSYANNPEIKANKAYENIKGSKTKNICKTCGTRYSTNKFDQDKCIVCFDDRQYVKAYGQQWLSYDDLSKSHSVQLKKHTKGLYEISVTPKFAIGQRAFFIESEFGNILWDCIPYLDEQIIEFIKSRGGLKAIAISHPHYYSLMNEWAKAFDCPIYIHKKDEDWVMDQQNHIQFWESNEFKINDNMKLVHIGGHFPGSSVFQTTIPEVGNTIFIGDTLYLSMDKKHISTMYSYPNFIPLKNSETLKVFDKVNTIEFDALFGAFSHQNLYQNAKRVFNNSYEIYRNIIS